MKRAKIEATAGWLLHRIKLEVFGTKRTSNCRAAMSAFSGKADMATDRQNSASDPFRTLSILIFCDAQILSIDLWI
jgi:hypothetical protein